MGLKRALNLARDRLHLAVLSGEAYARWRGVTVGDRCEILTRHFGSEPFLITIGDDVTVSFDVVFLTHDAATRLVRDERGRRVSCEPVRIGNSVFIGAGSIILPGVHIGDHCIVGAGSVVTKSLPDGSVVAGNPARWICSFVEYRERVLRENNAADDLRGDFQTRSLQSVTGKRKRLIGKPTRE